MRSNDYVLRTLGALTGAMRNIIDYGWTRFHRRLCSMIVCSIARYALCSITYGWVKSDFDGMRV